MANNVSGTSKDDDLSDDFLADDAESVGFDNEGDMAPRVSRKDPTIRRKIEDMLERRRLREELGIYDDDYWDDV